MQIISEDLIKEVPKKHEKVEVENSTKKELSKIIINSSEFQRFNLTDYIFLIVSILLYIITGYFLYQNLNFETRDAGQIQIGTLVLKENIAKRKLSNTFNWSPAENNIPIYNKDTILTENNSSAFLVLNDKTEIQVEANSLIYIEFSKKKTSLNVKGGNLSVKKNVASNTIELQAKNNIVELDKGELKVGVEGDTSSISIQNEGKAKFISDIGKQINIKENTILNISNKNLEISNPKIYLKQPQNGFNKVSYTPITPIDFIWENKDVLFKVFLQISSDSKFNKIILNTNVNNKNSYTHSLKQGTYFWRLKYINPINKKVTFTTSNRFILKFQNKIEKLELFSSQPNIEFSENTNSGNKTMVSLNWNKIEGSTSYTIEFSKSSDFKNIVEKSTISQNNKTIYLEPKKYYWRIKSNFPDGNFLMSKASELKVKKVSYEKENKNINVLNEANTLLLLSTNKNIKIDLEKLKNEKIKVNESNKLNTKLLEKNTLDENNENTLNKNLKVESLKNVVEKNNNQKVEPSKIEESNKDSKIEEFKKLNSNIIKKDKILSLKNIFKSKIEKIEILNPPDGVSFPKSKNYATYSWEGINGDYSYIFEISDDKKFKKIIQKNITKETNNTITLPIELKKKYYWQIKVFDKINKIIAQSNIYTFYRMDKDYSQIIKVDGEKIIGFIKKIENRIVYLEDVKFKIIKIPIENIKEVVVISK